MCAKRTTAAERRMIRKLRLRDGLTIDAVSVAVGVSDNTVRHYAPGRVGKVRNDQLRKEFLRSGLPASEIARRLGWVSGRRPDASRVLRTLGLRPDVNGRGMKSTRTWIDWEVGSRIAEAIGVAPWAVLDNGDVS